MKRVLFGVDNHRSLWIGYRVSAVRVLGLGRLVNIDSLQIINGRDKRHIRHTAFENAFQRFGFIHTVDIRRGVFSADFVLSRGRGHRQSRADKDQKRKNHTDW